MAHVKLSCMICRKQIALIYNEKNDILDRFDDLPKMSERKKSVAIGVANSILCDILKRREQIESFQPWRFPWSTGL